MGVCVLVGLALTGLCGVVGVDGEVLGPSSSEELRAEFEGDKSGGVFGAAEHWLVAHRNREYLQVSLAVSTSGASYESTLVVERSSMGRDILSLLIGLLCLLVNARFSEEVLSARWPFENGREMGMMIAKSSFGFVDVRGWGWNRIG